MEIKITISEQDFKAVLKTVMTIDDMENTTKGRIYGSITREGMKVYQQLHPEEFGVVEK
jgi:hypothetical protein